jgi:methylated-DNA-[protein]-cysteine S-methyltransferase
MSENSWSGDTWLHGDGESMEKTEKEKQMNTTYKYTTMKSPVGELKLIANENGLAAILWEKDRENPGRVKLSPLIEDKNNEILKATKQQLTEYFLGKRKVFDVPLDFKGTKFQKEVWAALLYIPYGETRSYGQLAKQLKRPNASRAVGAANGKNPISIIAPCHRVIGASGKLTGFAGGLQAKALLLELENEEVIQAEKLSIKERKAS